jgi:hypothetical protein
LIWAWASGGTVWDAGLTVVVVVGGAVVGEVFGAWVVGGVVGGLATVVVGWGRVDGGFVVVGAPVVGGAVVVGGGPTSCAWACQMAAAPKAMVHSTTMAAARQRVLTLLRSPRLGRVPAL